MRFRHFSALSMLVSGVCVTIALHGAAAQAPPPPASGQPAPTASPPNPPPPSQVAPPPPPSAAAPPPPPAQAAAPPDGPPPPQSGPVGHAAAHAVTHANVNLRNGPGTTFTIVTLIPAGSSVAVNGCRSGWCQVAFQDQNGYIIETSIAPGGPGPVRRPGPPPGYGGPPGPPPGYAGPPPGYYPPPPGYYPPPYYYGGYYGPGPWGWRGRGYGRRW
jgi:hypothetical protein